MSKLVNLLSRQKAGGLTRALLIPALGKLCVQVSCRRACRGLSRQARMSSRSSHSYQISGRASSGASIKAA